MIDRLRRLYDTLFGRTALVLAVTLVLAHSLPILIFKMSHPRPPGPPERDSVAIRWISEAESRRAIYASLPAGSRAAYVSASEEGPERLQSIEPQGFRPLEGRGADALQATVAAKLGPDSVLGYVPGPTPTQWLRFTLNGAPVWLSVPSPSFMRPELNIEPLVWITGGIALLGLAATLILLWPLYHPLRQLAAAQEALGRGEQVAPLPDSGPRELAKLSASFNRMVRDLAAVEEERRTLLAGVSHDLRTPLTRLRMRLALLDGVDSQPFERDLDDIERITEQFLDYVRGEAEEGRRQPLDLAELILDLRDRYGLTATIEVDLAPVATLEGDALALRRAMANLIDNALTHGLSPLAIQLRQVGDAAVVSLRDHGPGMAPEMLSAARQPFLRLDPARGGRGHCGLGLPIVERVVARHGGRLEMSNHPEGGLLATLHLPLSPKRSAQA